ncbi:hypothetical protein [Teichococcus aestuarii]|uniref:Uncharacterized protein n=1 Tax=Teichococcus aestuarii TaxID=568898 RepID=A0A2U1V7Y8_9PROT|nr:hypothetical protein [Pseudoroseomonas aestuarii]PWC30028.1 hypothetical protein CR165_03955 [Pseudoroseomonas aestuarii]
MRFLASGLACLGIAGALATAVPLWPAAGQPVAILFRPGLPAEQALLLTGAAGHRPMRLLHASPPLVLAERAPGLSLPHHAWLALAAPGAPGCTAPRTAARAAARSAARAAARPGDAA